MENINQLLEETKKYKEELLSALRSNAREVILLRLLEKRLKEISIKLTEIEKILNDKFI
jgi:hypothetical protein